MRFVHEYIFEKYRFPSGSGDMGFFLKSIPNYFNNSETPIICYKYNKPIRSTIFNFNKIVNDLDIDSNTPAS